MMKRPLISKSPPEVVSQLSLSFAALSGCNRPAIKEKKMARDTAELTDEQWEKSVPLFSAPHAFPWRGPKQIPNRPCFAGMLWILRTGTR
jgi:hypothetical protein